MVFFFSDFDGFLVELVEVEVFDDDLIVLWIEFVLEDVVICGFYFVMFWLVDFQFIEDFFEMMGFECVGIEEVQGDIFGDEWMWFVVIGSVGKYVDVLLIIESG